MHAGPEHGAAGVTRRGLRIFLQLVRVVPGDDLWNAIEVDVGERAERADAVAGDLTSRLRAQGLPGRGVVDAVPHDDLRAGGVRQKARDGGASPPHRRRRFTGLRIAAVEPEEIAILVEGDETAVLM